MSNNLIRYEDGRMRGSLSAAQRVSPNEIQEARRDAMARQASGEQGWFGILDDAGHLKAVKQAAERFGKIKNCLVLGIGGSDLGARAALAAMRLKDPKVKIWFAGDTTDPEALDEVLDSVPWKNTTVNVISKSGGTLETMAAFFAALERLEKAVGKTKAAERVICTTDPDKGDLHDLALKAGYAILPVPHNVGGRFSVLTAVGLFPLALAGIKIEKLLDGARQTRDDWMSAAGSSHAIDRFAAWHVAHDRAKRQIQTMLVYASALEPSARWWRQLWAESLGKNVKRDGRKHYDGPTPVVFLGPTDQHSQLQLYQDGPDDKVYTFLTVDNFRSKSKVPSAAKKFGPTADAAGKKFSDLLKAEAQGTAQALVDVGRPVGQLKLEKIDEAGFGALVMFMEIATAVAGAIYGINAFDQPGVEASKIQAKKQLAGEKSTKSPEFVI